MVSVGPRCGLLFVAGGYNKAEKTGTSIPNTGYGSRPGTGDDRPAASPARGNGRGFSSVFKVQAAFLSTRERARGGRDTKPARSGSGGLLRGVTVGGYLAEQGK